LSGRSLRAAVAIQIYFCVFDERIQRSIFHQAVHAFDGDIHLFVTRPEHAAEGGEVAHALQEIDEEREIAEGEVARAHGLTDEHENDARAKRGCVAIERAKHFVEKFFADG
jgi:hypothetical protein